MQDVFEEGQQGLQQGETQPTEQPQEPAQGAEQQPQEGQEATPPVATEQGKHVPLEALEAERKGRQDWKEKAIRYETELQQLRQQREQAERAEHQRQLTQEEREQNSFFNKEERAARREHGTETVDKAWQRVQQEFAKNPGLYQQVVAHPEPWEEVVRQGKMLMAMDEIGSDPTAYRAKVEAEIRASLTPQSSAPAAPPLPQSLAGARSAGARGNTFTGPTPMENIFER